MFLLYTVTLKHKQSDSTFHVGPTGLLMSREEDGRLKDWSNLLKSVRKTSCKWTRQQRCISLVFCLWARNEPVKVECTQSSCPAHSPVAVIWSRGQKTPDQIQALSVSEIVSLKHTCVHCLTFHLGPFSWGGGSDECLCLSDQAEVSASK